MDETYRPSEEEFWARFEAELEYVWESDPPEMEEENATEAD